jgi:hypothetical protein
MLGEAAYRAYFNSTGHYNLKKFEDLPEHIQTAWYDCYMAVVQEYVTIYGKMLRMTET